MQITASLDLSLFVFEKSYRLGCVKSRVYQENLMKVLECHSKGDTRFSPFFSDVSVFGQKKSIENHYHCAKVFEVYPENIFRRPQSNIISYNGFNHGIIPGDWRESKALSKAGHQQVAWKIGNIILPIRSSEGKRYELNDFGVQFYILLWYKHLMLNKWKIEYVKQFDEFRDPFKGTFPFCQAEVMKLVKEKGLPGLKEMADELWQLMGMDMPIIDYPIEQIQYGFVADAGYLSALYPFPKSYAESLQNAELGDVRIFGINCNLSRIKLFSQVDGKTDADALRKCVVKMIDVQSQSQLTPIYLHHTIFDGLNPDDKSQILSLIENHLLPVTIVK
ncbi:hypothetical protein [Laspinema olomoucense]|uniref:hypothetical protein n=1 Tax=Laspinema olomoucense TaxID=3231600 RepID=UPI0021BAB6FA|nr:hypothetical protein [Laspinema sp. D3d]MCT7971188.1 hypothetical protein [Laspinema sp. D3d]